VEKEDRVTHDQAQQIIDQLATLLAVVSFLTGMTAGWIFGQALKYPFRAFWDWRLTRKERP